MSGIWMKQAAICLIAVASLFGRPAVATAQSQEGSAAAIGEYTSFLASGDAAMQAGKYDDAIAIFTLAVERLEMEPDTRARVLMNRGQAWFHKGNSTKAIADFALAIADRRISPELAGKILIARAGAYDLSRGREALSDYTAVADNPGVSGKLRSMALFNRALTRGQLGDHDGEVMDYAAAIAMPGAPSDIVASSLINRGLTRMSSANSGDAEADFARVGEMQDAPPDLRSDGLRNLAICWLLRGKHEAAFRMFDSAMEVGQITPHRLARARLEKAIGKQQIGQNEEAAALYEEILSIRELPTDDRADTLLWRARLRLARNETRGSKEDCNEVIRLATPSTYAATAALEILEKLDGKEQSE